jgi:serine/threonine protein kinase/tetratricopeptide (TPR) repeat protein
MLSSVKRTVLDAGTVVGRYRIIEEIDRGGMAVVYKALQLDLNRVVALKVMPANVTLNYRFVERFLSEAHSVAKLSHPGIVNIYEVATENNVYYIAMEYISGQNLYQYLNDAKPKLVDVLEIVSRLTEALSYAHSQKIIHRDLKLNNVIMKGPLTPVLIDFGLAKALEESDSGGGITRTGEIMGSPAYMAPERLLGENVDHRSDICSLGIMLYEMLTFKNPYLDQRNLHQTTYNVMEANPIPPKNLIPWLPVEVEAITLKAMAKDPAMRYQSMDELRADIQRYQKGEAVLAKPPSFKKRTARFMRKKWAPLAISFLIMVFSGLLAANHYIQSKKVMSHWQLVYSQQTKTSGEWVFVDSDSLRPGRFEDAAKFITLSAAAGGLSYARLERRFNRDILVEFEVRAPDRDLFRAGVFLFDETPDSALRIHLNRDGAGASGITFPGRGFLFQDIDNGAIPWQANNTIAIERMNNAITLTINGTQAAKVYDFFPPIGKPHEKLGFFVEGSEAIFSNIKIHRRAIPRVTSPTLIADRFWERGDFESAIDEYNGLMVDQSTLNIAKELYIKIADCQLRLDRYEDALATLEKSAQMHGSDALKARARYLSGLAYMFLGDTAKAEGTFNIIARYYKYSPVNFPIMASALTKCAAMIDSGYVDEALDYIRENVALYPKYAHLWGVQHLRILNKSAKSGNVDMTVKSANEIYTLYGATSETAAFAKTAIAEAYLNAGQTASAAEIYNQSIHTPTITDHVWRSWYALGELYEYDFNYEYAKSLYSKIWKESSASSVIHWMAALKCAEYQVSDSSLVLLDKIPLLHEIVNGDHPFPLPRLIASYYLDKITEIEFMNKWESLSQTDSWCLYYIAKKLLLQGNREEAVSVVRVLERQYPAVSWESYQIAKILRNEDRWQ